MKQQQHVDYGSKNISHILSTQTNLSLTQAFLASILQATPIHVALKYNIRETINKNQRI